VAVLTALSTLSPDASPVPPGAEFFQAIKSLTVTGYYTSEIAMREEIGDDGLMFFAEFTGLHAQGTRRGNSGTPSSEDDAGCLKVRATRTPCPLVFDVLAAILNIWIPADWRDSCVSP
jgi:hypothetical protein